MGSLRVQNCLLILGFFVGSQTHVIRRRDTSVLEISGNFPEDLRSPQKYIITQVQSSINNSENDVVSPNDTVDFGAKDDYNEIQSLDKTEEDFPDSSISTNDRVITTDEDDTITNVSGTTQNIDKPHANEDDSKKEAEDMEIKSLNSEITAKHIDQTKVLKADDSNNSSKSKTSLNIGRILANSEDIKSNVEDAIIIIQKKTVNSGNKDNIKAPGTKLVYATPDAEISQEFGRNTIKFEEEENIPKLPETVAISQYNGDTTKEIKFQDHNSSSEFNEFSIISNPFSDSSIPKESVAETEAKKQETESNSKATQEINAKSVEDKKDTQILEPRQVLDGNTLVLENLLENVEESKEAPQKLEETLDEMQLSSEFPLIIKLKDTNNVPQSVITQTSESKPDEIFSEVYEFSKNNLKEFHINGKVLDVVTSEAEEEINPTNGVATASIESENEMLLSPEEFSVDELATVFHSALVIQTEDADVDLELDTTLSEDMINSRSETSQLDMEDYDEMTISPLLKAIDVTSSNDKELIGNLVVAETVGDIAQSMTENNIETVANPAHTSATANNIKATIKDNDESSSTLPEKDIKTCQDSEKLHETITVTTLDENPFILVSSVTSDLNEASQDSKETSDEASTPEAPKDAVECGKTSATNKCLNPIKSTPMKSEKKNENSGTGSQNSEMTNDKENKETELRSTIQIPREARQTEIKPDNLIGESSAFSSTEIQLTGTSPNQIINETVASTSAVTPSILEPIQNTETNEQKPSTAEISQAETKPTEFTKTQETIKDTVENDATTATDLKPIKSTEIEKNNENSGTVSESTDMTTAVTNNDTEFPSTAVQSGTKPVNLISESIGVSSPETPTTESSTSAATSTAQEPTQNIETNNPPQTETKPTVFTKPTELTVNGKPAAIDTKPINSPPTESSPEKVQSVTNPLNLVPESSGSSSTETPTTETSSSAVTPSIQEPTLNIETSKPNPSSSASPQVTTKPTESTKPTENLKDIVENGVPTATNAKPINFSPIDTSTETVQSVTNPLNVVPESSGSASIESPTTETSASAITPSIQEPTQNLETSKPNSSSSESNPLNLVPESSGSSFTETPTTETSSSAVTPSIQEPILNIETSKPNPSSSASPQVTTKPTESTKPTENLKDIVENGKPNTTGAKPINSTPTESSPETLQSVTNPLNLVSESSGSTSPETPTTEMSSSAVTPSIQEPNQHIETSKPNPSSSESPQVITKPTESTKPTETENLKDIVENGKPTATDTKLINSRPTESSPEAVQSETNPTNLVPESSGSSSPEAQTTKMSSAAGAPSILAPTQNIETSKPNPLSSDALQVVTKPIEFTKPPENLNDVVENGKPTATNVGTDPKPINFPPVESSPQTVQSETKPVNLVPQSSNSSSPETPPTATSSSVATPPIQEPTQNIETSKPNPLSSEAPQVVIKPIEFTKPTENVKDALENGKPTATNAATDPKPITTTPTESPKKQDNSGTANQTTEISSDETKKDTALPSPTLISSETAQSGTKPVDLVPESSGSSSSETPTTETSTSAATPSIPKPTQNIETSKPNPLSSEAPQAIIKPFEFAKPLENLKDAVQNGEPSATNVATDPKPINSSRIESTSVAVQSETKPVNLIPQSSGPSSPETPTTETSTSSATPSILEPTENTETNKAKPFLSETPQVENKPNPTVSPSLTVPSQQKPTDKTDSTESKPTISSLPQNTIPSLTTGKPETQQTSLNQNNIPSQSTTSTGNNIATNTKPDAENQGDGNPTGKPLTDTTTTLKPVTVAPTNSISTKKPIRGTTARPATRPTRKLHRRRTTANPAIAAAASNQINKRKPLAPRPATSKPSTNNSNPTKSPNQHPWFPNFPGFGGQSKPLFPAIFVNHFNTTKRNKTQTGFGLGLFAVPWKWRPMNLTKLHFLGPKRVIKPLLPKPDEQKQEDLGRDLAFWNVLFHKSSANDTGGLFNQFAASKWNSTTENSRRINATTPASLNNSTLEVTSSGGGSSSRDSGGENTPPTPVTASTGLNPAGRQCQQRFVATLNCINGSSNVNNVEDENDDNDQFIVNRQRQQQQQHQQQLVEQQHQRQRPILCRTPPPNYHSLAVTPPPSYTPRQQIQTSPANSRAEDVAAPHQQHHQHRQHPHPHSHSHPPSALRRCQVPEVLGLGIDGYDDDAQLNGPNFIGRQQHQQATARAIPEQTDAEGNAEAVVVNAQNRRQVLVANGRLQQRNVATVSQQQRRRKQRRRKLHLLQQHQQQQHYNLHQQNLPIINVSTSDSDSSSSLSDISQDSNELAIGGTTRDQRRRRRQRLLKLRDAYCPDLLNACSLILLQQQTSDSTVGSFTDTPPELVHDSSDYVEIAEYQRNPPRLQNAQSTPEIRQRHRHHHRQNQIRLNGFEERRPAATRERAASEAEENQRLQNFKQEMGQNLSIRRPRISLTWVLREQHQQQQQQQQQPNEQEAGKTEVENNKENQKETQGNKTQDPQRLTNNNQVNGKVSRNQEANNQNSGVVEKKKYRLKQIPGSTEPLNGYATTPTSYTNASTALGSQKFFSNQNLLEYHKDDAGAKPPSKDLLFVCTPQRVPEGFGGSSEALALAKKRNEIRKKLAAKMAQFRSENQATRLVTNISTHLNGGVVSLKRESKSSLKSGSYSEPSLIAASEGNSRRHRHRKRRERNRPPKFGYDIKNVDEFLTKCSLASPANIPMVLSTSCILYQTRPGGYQTEISLPLGMVVNAVFKNQNWLYVQTPHAEEGYVNYTTCLPLGILPPEARKEGKSEAKSKPCWDTNGDVFPKPCGNMTDSEKEIHLRVGTRSEGARTPRLKNQLTDNEAATVISAKTDTTDCINGNTTSIYGEQQVDKLYLRAASQPKLAEKASYAQLKIIRNHSSAASATSSKSQINDEYVTLHQKGGQKHIHHIPAQKTYISRTFITNGHNGQHLHPKDMKNLQQQQQIHAAANNCNNLKNPTATQQQQLNNATTTITVTSYPPAHQIQSQQQQQQQQQLHHNPTQPHRHHHHHQQQQQQQQSLTSSTSLHHINNQSSMTAATTTATTTTVAPRSILNAIRRSSAHCGQRQTLVAITTDYSTGDGLTLQKGDIVTLCECRETKDHRQWFYVRTRDGRQGYIPAEVAGHGYL